MQLLDIFRSTYISLLIIYLQEVIILDYLKNASILAESSSLPEFKTWLSKDSYSVELQNIKEERRATIIEDRQKIAATVELKFKEWGFIPSRRREELVELNEDSSMTEDEGIEEY